MPGTSSDEIQDTKDDFEKTLDIVQRSIGDVREQQKKDGIEAEKSNDGTEDNAEHDGDKLNEDVAGPDADGEGEAEVGEEATENTGNGANEETCDQAEESVSLEDKIEFEFKLNLTPETVPGGDGQDLDSSNLTDLLEAMSPPMDEAEEVEGEDLPSLNPADKDVNDNGAVEASCDLTNDVNYNPDDGRIEDSPPVLPDPVRVTASQEDGGEEELIELDAVGTVDDLDRDFLNTARSFETYKDLDCEIVANDDIEEIELSSDEEADHSADVSVVLLRRPPVVEPSHEATIDILDSDDEYPVCVVEGERQENINIEEKKGFIKEFIEREGLGIIFSETHGLVLFHISHVWINGSQSSAAATRHSLAPGDTVSFYDQTLAGPEYRRLSSEEVCHQALVVWTGERPAHLMRTIDTLGHAYTATLATSRDGFMVYLKGEVFLPLAIVRTRGVVIGYISDNLGVIESYDRHRNKVNVFFHTDDVWIFKKPLRKYEQQYNSAAGRLLPVGLAVSIDARAISVPGVAGLDYQAVAVLAGSWPSTPAPTLLPGGPGTFTETYDVPEGNTFYYLELSLEAKLAQKVELLKEELRHSRGDVRFVWRGVNVIKCEEDKQHWRSQFTSRPRPPRDSRTRGGRGGGAWERRAVTHVFRAPPPRVVKTKQELDTDGASSVATAGGSHRGSISDVASEMSRPLSRLSTSSSTVSSKSRRDWYNPGNWQHGGLRIKTEIKSELDDGSSLFCGPASKKIKLEK